MFGSLGGIEVLFVFVLALLLFGPRKLPEIGKTIGKTVLEFRRATNEFKYNLEREVEIERLRETRQGFEDAGQSIRQAGEAMAHGPLTPPLSSSPPAAPEPPTPADGSAAEKP